MEGFYTFSCVLIDLQSQFQIMCSELLCVTVELREVSDTELIYTLQLLTSTTYFLFLYIRKKLYINSIAGFL